jgi:hypothetical protein
MTANRLALIDDNSQPLPEYWLFVVGQMTEDDVIQIADGDVGYDFHGHLSGIRTLMESTSHLRIYHDVVSRGSVVVVSVA